MSKHCRARSRSGKPCGCYAVEGSEFCFTHDPRKAAERDRAHQRGGQNRSRNGPASPFPEVDTQTIAGLLEINDCLIRETWMLENSPERTRTLLALVRAQREVIQTNLIESRVAALERALERRKEDETRKA